MTARIEGVSGQIPEKPLNFEYWEAAGAGLLTAKLAANLNEQTFDTL